MNTQFLFNFKTDLSKIKISKKLNNPFDSFIPEIGKIAAKEFQAFITLESQGWAYDFRVRKGKMFGILVVQKEDNSYLYIGTISGKIPGDATCNKFIPSVFDTSTDDFFINKGMTELTDISNIIKKTSNQKEIIELIKSRKLKSIALQQRLFENYQFLNLLGLEQNLLQIFKNSSHGNPPSAAGECVAPKLLHYAFKHGLRPVALAEFWWGSSPKSKERKHKVFYPACKNKCRPILEYMLDDMELFKQANANRKSMRIIYCDSGFSPKEVDYMYAAEYKSAKQQFIQTALISFEALKRGDLQTALKRVRLNEEKEMGIYRGWMLTPNQYELLYNALLEKNIELINTPNEYKFCHYLPENYETIKDFTPKTTFKELTSDFKMEDFQNEIGEFGDKPIVLKDYVKSQKHYWEEACFIPNAADKEKVNSVVQKFLELQDVDLNEGLVFREYIELEALANHSKSGMPLTKEFRVFVKNGEIMTIYKYWDEGDYQNVQPIVKTFEEIIPNIKSNFFTMDIAKKKDGDWIIVELGDGQVAGLPDNADKDEFYEELKQ